MTTIAGYFRQPPSGGPPVAQPSGAPQTPGGYRLLDNRRVVQPTDAPADTNGNMTATFPAVDAGTMWLVDRAAIYTTSSAPTLAFVYAGQIAPQNILDGSVAGNLDFADNAAPWLVPGSLPLVFLWEQATPGATGFAVVQYRLLG